MPDRIYEHHVAIRKDKLCPFKLSFAHRSFDCVCNWHKNIEVILVAEGEGAIRYGSLNIPLAKDDIIIVNTETLHRLYSRDGISFYYLIIDEAFCIENGLSTDSRVFDKIFRSRETKSLFEGVIKQMAEYAESKPPALQASKVRLAVLALLIDLCEKHSEPRENCEKAMKNTDAYIQKTMEYMGLNYHEPLTLESLAQICGITKCYLAREFKAYTGQTVMTYLNMVRCKNAEICLAEGRSVTETAYECGFESISYFSRTYKRIMGVPPSRSMKKQTTEDEI